LYKTSPGLQLKAGYSRRIQRSASNQLNPIPEREHSETLEMGDPDLKPEFINSGEIGLTKVFNGGSSVFLTAYIQDPVILGAPPIDIDKSGWVYSINGKTTFHIGNGSVAPPAAYFYLGRKFLYYNELHL
jgi:hypothetical protein